MPFSRVHKVNTYTAMNPAPKTPVVATFQPGEALTLVRSVDGSVAVDPTTYDGATYPPGTYGFSCDRYDTVLIGATFSGSGSIKVVPMIYDPDSELWMSLYLSGGVVQESQALDGSGGYLVPLTVYGAHAVFFRISSVTGTLTDLELFVRPGQGRSYAFFG